MGKLHEQMKADLTLKGYSPCTAAGYLPRCRKFAQHFNRSPEEMGREEIRAFLLYLAEEQKVSPALQKAYLVALKFLYRHTLNRPEEVENLPNPKQPRQLPVVLSREEVLAIFEAIGYIKHKAMIATTYGAGLRISEVCALRKSDIDSQRMLIRVRQGKGRKDRYTLLSQRALAVLREYWRAYRPPGWLFPGLIPGRPLTRSAVQRSFAHARRAAGIGKPASPHSLRHALASHLLEAGVHLHLIQRLLGHASPRTTTVYLHVSPADLASIANPMDRWSPPASPTP